MGFINEFAQKTGFPPEAALVFCSLEEQIKENTGIERELHRLTDSMMKNEMETAELLKELDSLAKALSVFPYTMHLHFFIRSAQPLKEAYIREGISLEIYWDSMTDLRCKLMECHEVHGIWGSFVANWFPEFFRLERFALGRFQYQPMEFPYDLYEKGGVAVKKGDLVYNMHIPSSGKMNQELRIDSYRKAFEFYSKDQKPLVIVCHSWLLYPGNREFLPASSNILDFMEDFDIIAGEDTDSFDDAWRIFGSRYQEPPEKLPGDTSLQRAFIKRLAEGGKTGVGFGVLIFDGEKII